MEWCPQRTKQKQKATLQCVQYETTFGKKYKALLPSPYPYINMYTYM